MASKACFHVLVWVISLMVCRLVDGCSLFNVDINLVYDGKISTTSHVAMLNQTLPTMDRCFMLCKAFNPCNKINYSKANTDCRLYNFVGSPTLDPTTGDYQWAELSSFKQEKPLSACENKVCTANQHCIVDHNNIPHCNNLPFSNQ